MKPRAGRGTLSYRAVHMYMLIVLSCLVGLEAEAEFTDVGNNSGGGELLSTPPRTPGSLTRNSCNSAGSSGNSTKTQMSPQILVESESESLTSKPKQMRLLSDIYNEAPEVELIDDELMMITIDEPTTYKQAAEKEEWRKAMKTEIDAIEHNKTLQLTELPAGHKAIGLKWVFKIKKDANGNIVKHKARLVAKGYVQQQGVDYEEAFAPVTRLEQ